MPDDTPPTSDDDRFSTDGDPFDTDDRHAGEDAPPTPDADPFDAPTDRTVPLVRLPLVEEFDDRPDRCIIYSARDPETLHSTWIAARGSAFVAVEDAR